MTCRLRPDRPLFGNAVESYRSAMRFHMLGPLEVDRDGKRVPLGGPKQRLVLAHLLVRVNEVVSTDLLVDKLWGDEPPDAARASLYSYVSHLRKAVGADRLASRPPGYILRASAAEIDARRFEALVAQGRRRMNGDTASAARTLREALALWRGDPFADLAEELSLRGEIERLSELRIGALEDRIEADLALGRHDQVVAELEQLVQRHPLRERLWGRLMLALYRSGRQADALAAYHQLRRTLDDELGVQPSPAIEALQRRILNHDPNLDLRGEPLRGYRVVGRVAAGQLRVIHRALEPHTEREVSITVLGTALSNDAEFVRRFDAEARRVAKLDHPHIGGLLDWWREPDAAYLVWRLLRGGNLAERFARGQVSSMKALHWAEQVAAALAYAHREGVTHGDLRPDSVRLDDEENAYLTDFAIGYDGAIEHVGNDARYLAPERRAGASPSAATDIYAFGVLLIDLLLGAALGSSGARLRVVLDSAVATNADERPRNAADLVAAVRRAFMGDASASELPARVSGLIRNPYKGLRAFAEGDAADFFGREELVGQLAALLSEPGDASRLLAVVGPSGSGKSSVVSAGLIPALRGGSAPGSNEWLIAIMTPGERPFENLEQALLGVAVEAPPSLAALLTAEDGLGPAVEQLLPAGTELLLVIDQFEELFTLVEDAPVHRRFLDVIAASIAAPASRVRVVITLRADFFDRPLRHEAFGRQLASRTVAVPPLTPEQFERVIAQPAQRGGLRLEAGLVARIVAEMSQQPGALPLLQYALTELWERREGRRLSLRSYEASGGIAAAVGRRADQLVDALSADVREVARQLFLRLVELGEGTPDTARRVSRSELSALVRDREQIEGVIDLFGRYRLLLLDRDPETREATVELAHEALLSAWPGLRRWIDEARDDLRQQRRVAAAAGQWLEAGRDGSFLLTGSRLAQTDEWARSTTVLLTQSEREYLAASVAERRRQAVEEERRRAHEAALETSAVTRLRALVATFAAAAVVAGALSVYAVGESNQAAREARSAGARELAAAAVANLEVDAQRSILLALAAIDRTRSVDGIVLPEAEEALHRAVVASRIVLTVPGVGGQLDWSADERLFATGGGSGGGTVDIRDAQSGELVISFDAHDGDLTGVAFSADGSMLATTGGDGYLRVWDTGSGKELASVGGRSGTWASGPSFSADGMLVAAAWSDERTVRLLDVERGLAVLEASVIGEPRATSFSPDGSRLAVAAGYPPKAVVIDVASGQPVVQFGGDHTWSVEDVAWSPDGKSIATASLDGTALIWDAQTGRPRLAVVGHAASVRTVAWNADGTRLVTGSEDGSARVWSVTEFGVRQLHVLRGQDATDLTLAAISADGHRVMTTDGSRTAAHAWNVGISGSAEVATVQGHWDALGGLDFAEGRLVADMGDGYLGVWDSETWQQLLRIGPWRGVIFSVDVSPDGTLIAAANAEDPALVWDARTGQKVRFVDHQPSGEVEWSPDGELLATVQTDGSVVEILDREGTSVRTLAPASGVWLPLVRFSPDGRLLAIGRWADEPLEGSGTTAVVEIWDWQAGTLLHTLPTAADEAAFDPTGARLAVGRHDGFAEVWDFASERLLTTMTGMGGGAVTGVAFHPDGTIVATGSRDGSVRLWDADTGRQWLELHGHQSGIWRVKFSPDGSKLASSSHDGTVRVWAIVLDDLIEIARKKLTRGLTDAECRQYLHAGSC